MIDLKRLIYLRIRCPYIKYIIRCPSSPIRLRLFSLVIMDLLLELSDLSQVTLAGK